MNTVSASDDWPRARALWLLLSLSAVLTTAASPATAQLPDSVPPAGSLTQLVDSLERTGFSGSVLIADRRNVRLFRSMGVADRSTGRPIVTTDVWRWASVSKQITATLVLREVDRGRVALDAPVSTYLPEFAAGARAEITVRHLLQHTSGLSQAYEEALDAGGVPVVYQERGPNVGDAAFARL